MEVKATKGFTLAITFLLICYFNNGFAQSSAVNEDSRKSLPFSCSFPHHWKFLPDSASNEFGAMITTDSLDAKNYEDCYEGVIFYITIHHQPLDSVLGGLYIEKDGKYFSTFSFMDDTPRETENIKGNGWNGIHHINSCRISCKEDDISAIVDGCEFIYFSNQKLTIEFSTTGLTFNESVYRNIISTFQFK